MRGFYTSCWKHTVSLCVLLCLVSVGVRAELHFPALTGRVVDEAGILDQQTKQAITELLAKEESQTSNQVVVVTLKSLQGDSIEDYGYQLGRHWGIGQAKLNNGVLLIVAPNEHKVRIEVGYGLEGTLTDAYSSVIIHKFIIPRFKQGEYSQGILIGVQKILAVLAGSYKPRASSKPNKGLTGLFYFILFIIFIMYGMFGGGSGGSGRRRGRGGYWVGWTGGNSSSGYGGGGSFGGGGGSFGGGGASGGW